MKEELVSFETAKLLKEKGFVNLSDKSYIISEGARYGLLSNFTNKYNNSVETNRVEAPTQSLAQKWLREKHSIHVELYRNASGWGWILTTTNTGSTLLEINDDIFFGSHEEALEEGLKEGLKLIE